MESNLDRVKKLQKMQPIRFDNYSSGGTEDNENSARIERLEAMQPIRISENRLSGK